ncbi:Trigger factor [Candidatus Nitrotoga sp. HW29]|uniref:trigger factor n=1 Tax=Candidatus Nitrotoga sp. HW29 TaxID=2886963 RepID=UPI001EF25EA9|nr:trigger factor [Candidatus Nitrotoga sp. HW29]CAH1903731.1 Trigger factor [Candidatus Nitrotoga sp. HW29]
MSSIEIMSGLERRLNASIPLQLVSSEMETRLKNLARTAEVPGFRPGKVPFKILEQKHGAQIQQEVLQDALRQSFAKEAQDSQLRVVGYPAFEVKATDSDALWIEYSATFEVYPEVVLGDISAESIEQAVYTLSDADVDTTIATLRKQHATFAAVDRAAQNGDRVHIDFSGLLEGKIFEGGEARNLAVLLGVGRLLPDFENAIIGMKAGETKSFDMTFPADYQAAKVAGKPATFVITLHKVEEQHLPELDASFAKLLGIEDGDVDKLKVEIRDNLGREIKRRLMLRNKDSVMATLLKVTQLEIPKALLDAEAQSLMQQALRDMKKRRIEMPKGEESLPLELFTERAQKRVKLSLILTELVGKYDLHAKPEQVKALIQDYAQSYDNPEEVVQWHYNDPARLQDAENLVLEDNVVVWVTDTVKVIEKVMEFNVLMENAA